MKLHRTDQIASLKSGCYTNHRVYAFGDFALDVDQSALFRAGEQVDLRPKAFDVLRYLVDNQGRLVGREELHDAIWGISVVTDDAVNHCLIDIRKALSDSSHSIIRTIPRRGYIFNMPVTRPTNGVDAQKAATSPALAKAFGRWSAGLGAIVILGLLAVFIPITSDRPTASRPNTAVEVATGPSIAVLPFAVLSDDLAQTYFADGISEEILNLLARQRGLKVIARTSSFSFRDENVDILTLAEQLGVSHVLEGSFREDDDQIRINVQLIEAATGELLWARSFNRTLSASSIFEIQSEIAAAVSQSLKTKLPTQEFNRPTKMPTDNLEALDDYFEGRAKMETLVPERLAEASLLFEKAVEHDPDFALAYIAFAEVCFMRAVWGSLPISTALRRARTSVEAALTIDDQLGEANLPLGKLLEWESADLASAEKAFLEGIALSPYYAPLYQAYAELLSFSLARPHDALRYSKMSVVLDPRSPIIVIDYARVLAEAGELDQALEQVDLAIAIDPTFAVGYYIKAETLHVYKGEIAETIPLYEQAYRITPQSPLIVSGLGGALIDLGYVDRAGKLIDASAPLYPETSFFHQMRASMLILQGDHAGAAEIAQVVLNDLPNVPWALGILRDLYIKEHKYEAALDHYERSYAQLLDESSEAVDLVGWQFLVAIDLSVLLLKIGRTENAVKLLAAALDEANRRRRLHIGPPNIHLARIHALLGDTDAAIVALQWAIDAGWRTGWQLQLYHDAALESVRDLPEFQALVARVEADVERQQRELETHSVDHQGVIGQ